MWRGVNVMWKTARLIFHFIDFLATFPRLIKWVSLIFLLLVVKLQKRRKMCWFVDERGKKKSFKL
jgi:hypothetical protein